MITLIKGFEQYVHEKDHGQWEDQTLYKFNNGYGASIIFHEGSYGFEEGKMELAVLEWTSEKNWSLTYDTSITDDVMGYLTLEEASDILKKIQELPEVKS